MKVIDWLINNNTDSFYNKSIENFLDVKVVEEVSSVGMNWDEYLKKLHSETSFNCQHLYSYIILENGYCIGLNESLSRGYTTPSCKLKDKEKAKQIAADKYKKICDILINT